MWKVPEVDDIVPAQRDRRSRSDADSHSRSDADRHFRPGADSHSWPGAYGRSPSGGGGDVQDMRGLLHDVGHGLATLSLLLESARAAARRDDPAQHESLLAMVGQETARLSELVHRNGARQRRTVPVMPVLERVVTLADRSRSATVVLAGDPDLPRLVDPNLVWRIVSNLVDNAARATGDGGTVRVHAAIGPAVRGRPLVICVDDDGPGFGHGPSGVASLGLGVVRRLVSSCGGRMTIAEAPSGRGTRVWVTLPEPTRSRPAPRPAPPVVRGTAHA